MTILKSFSSRIKQGFSLVELLVSMAILSLILVVLAQTTGALGLAVTQTTSGIQEYQTARDAFETMTRRISQATLNTYNDSAAYAPCAGSSGTVGYTRASELRFISGPASLTATALNKVAGPLFTGTSPYHPTHAIFFQAPLGKASTTTYAPMLQLLNTCGYYIEWNSNANYEPPFLTSSATYQLRYRYRLMELIEPSDHLTVYSDSTQTPPGTSGAYTYNSNLISASWAYTSKDWFQYPYNNSTVPANTAEYQCARPIAENIILLAFLPMLAPQNAQYPSGGAQDGTSTDLMYGGSGSSPGYLYDTAPIQDTTGIPVSQNTLPPMVYVLMIAVDEKSFSRYQLQRGNSSACPTNLGIDSPSSNTTFLTNSSYTQRLADVQQVENTLQTLKIGYRVFSTAIPITSHD